MPPALLRLLLLSCLLLLPRSLGAQAPGRVLVRTTHEGAAVEGVQVFSGDVGGLTGADGRLELRLPPGPATLRAERIGYAARRIEVVVPAGGAVSVEVELEEAAVEGEEIVVTSTRTERRIEDEPIRVEVVAREEVEEKLLMTPGDIAMLLNETAGLRVQSTAPSLGGASVRIQGLRGRYTQVLADGLPLYGGQTGALGPLQIPPMDLAQVEIIKGAASALYGASALGGVVNLISRRPAEGGERELMLNQSTLGATDGIGWASGPLGGRWGYTLIASGHRQERADVDDDGWADVPTYRRFVARPRLSWTGDGGSTALLTVGGMIEDREGGTMPGRTTPALTEFREGLDTRRADVGVVARFVGQGRILTVRGSGALQRHAHRFGERGERDRHATGFAEAALSGASGAHSWVLGAALQHDAFDGVTVPGFDYAFTVPGLFAQDEWAPSDWLTLSASARLDRHDEYGTFFNPRLSALLRAAGGWTARATAGTGYFAPTPWMDETEAVGLGRVVPPSGLEAERARSASVDLGRVIGPLELNLTWFGSTIDDAVQARPAAPSTGGDGRLALFNAGGAVRTTGTELLARFEGGGVHVSATHVWMRSTEPDPDGAGRRDVPLTPEHTAGLVAAWEQEGRGRLGIELYYTGTQALDDDPYRRESEDYLLFGFLVERRVGPLRAFLNAENVFDTRQTRYESLVRPQRSAEGLWITDVWAPLEGRSFNGGLRWMID